MPTDNEFTRILQWPGYRVYRHVIDEKSKTLELWVRRKRGNRKLECSGCGPKFQDAYDSNEWGGSGFALEHVRDYGAHRDASGEMPGLRG